MSVGVTATAVWHAPHAAASRAAPRAACGRFAAPARFGRQPLHLADVRLRRLRQVLLRVFGEPLGRRANALEVGPDDGVPDGRAFREVLAHPGTQFGNGLGRVWGAGVP